MSDKFASTDHKPLTIIPGSPQNEQADGINSHRPILIYLVTDKRDYAELLWRSGTSSSHQAELKTSIRDALQDGQCHIFAATAFADDASSQ